MENCSVFAEPILSMDMKSLEEAIDPEPPLQLTENLYPKDEAEISLLESLLAPGIDIRVCYFWLLELVLSGYDVPDLLTKFYLMLLSQRRTYLS